MKKLFYACAFIMLANVAYAGYGGGGGVAVSTTDAGTVNTDLQNYKPFVAGSTDYIQGALNSEIVNRGSADANISASTGAIVTEIINRENADTAISNATGTINTALSNEIINRTNADTAISNATGTITTNLNNEIINRGNADQTISNSTGVIQAQVTVITSTLNPIQTHLGRTDNPHAVTKTQVGLSAVTNDAQLKRASADFASFDAKTNPTASDIILIEDAGASQAKKYSLFGDISHTILKDIGTNTHDQIDSRLISISASTNPLREFYIAFSSSIAVGDEAFADFRASSYTLVSLKAYAEVAPVGANLAFHVTNRQGDAVMIGTLSIPAGLTESAVITSTYTIKQDGRIKVRVTNIGSTVAGYGIGVSGLVRPTNP